MKLESNKVDSEEISKCKIVAGALALRQHQKSNVFCPQEEKELRLIPLLQNPDSPDQSWSRAGPQNGFLSPEFFY